MPSSGCLRWKRFPRETLPLAALERLEEEELDEDEEDDE
jgi:hypothetical protein